jgi:hypothetical protein
VPAKALGERVDGLPAERPGHAALCCPGACGVNVTATMAALEIDLEWPPVRWAYRVALVGRPRRRHLGVARR